MKMCSQLNGRSNNVVGLTSLQYKKMMDSVSIPLGQKKSGRGNNEVVVFQGSTAGVVSLKQLAA